MGSSRLVSGLVYVVISADDSIHRMGRFPPQDSGLFYFTGVAFCPLSPWEFGTSPSDSHHIP